MIKLYTFVMFVLRLESQRCDIAGFSTFIEVWIVYIITFSE